MKKQTQFVNVQKDVMRVITMVYGNINGMGLRENKANSKPNKAKRSQSEQYLDRPQGRGKKEKGAKQWISLYNRRKAESRVALVWLRKYFIIKDLSGYGNLL